MFKNGWLQFLYFSNFIKSSSSEFEMNCDICVPSSIEKKTAFVSAGRT